MKMYLVTGILRPLGIRSSSCVVFNSECVREKVRDNSAASPVKSFSSIKLRCTDGSRLFKSSNLHCRCSSNFKKTLFN